MRMPYRNRAIIPPEKISNYLLSLTHETGKHKAFLFGRIGFSEINKDAFEIALLSIASTNDVKRIEDIIPNGRILGKKYIIEGVIIGSNGTLRIVTVWQLLNNKRKPSLVTVSKFRVV